MTNNDTFICRYSVINKLIFDDFTNEKDFKLLNVKADKPDGKLVIKDSYLGKMYWSSVDFGAMHTAQIENSTLIDLIPTNLKLPKNIIGQNETDFEDTKEACRQLKYIYNKQSNLSEELKYKQLEMEAFSRQSNLSWGDKFILWSNRISNNHGQDWRNGISLFDPQSGYLASVKTVYVFTKILNGYLLYQVYQAFRKFVR